jgi:hypothetical protein
MGGERSGPVWCLGLALGQGTASEQKPALELGLVLARLLEPALAKAFACEPARTSGLGSELALGPSLLRCRMGKTPPKRGLCGQCLSSLPDARACCGDCILPLADPSPVQTLACQGRGETVNRSGCRGPKTTGSSRGPSSRTWPSQPAAIATGPGRLGPQSVPRPAESRLPYPCGRLL